MTLEETVRRHYDEARSQILRPLEYIDLLITDISREHPEASDEEIRRLLNAQAKD